MNDYTDKDKDIALELVKLSDNSKKSVDEITDDYLKILKKISEKTNKPNDDPKIRFI